MAYGNISWDYFLGVTFTFYKDNLPSSTAVHHPQFQMFLVQILNKLRRLWAIYRQLLLLSGPSFCGKVICFSLDLHPV